MLRDARFVAAQAGRAVYFGYMGTCMILLGWHEAVCIYAWARNRFGK